MRPSEIIKGKPVFELHVKLLMRREAIFEEEILIEDSPPSFYLSIGLRSSYPGILVYNMELPKELLEAMFPISSALFLLIVGGKFSSIV